MLFTVKSTNLEAEVANPPQAAADTGPRQLWFSPPAPVTAPADQRFTASLDTILGGIQTAHRSGRPHQR